MAVDDDWPWKILWGDEASDVSRKYSQWEKILKNGNLSLAIVPSQKVGIYENPEFFYILSLT